MPISTFSVTSTVVPDYYQLVIEEISYEIINAHLTARTSRKFWNLESPFIIYLRENISLSYQLSVCI